MIANALDIRITNARHVCKLPAVNGQVFDISCVINSGELLPLVKLAIALFSGGVHDFDWKSTLPKCHWRETPHSQTGLGGCHLQFDKCESCASLLIANQKTTIRLG